MREPHIVVCMKVVPKAEEIQVDPETLLLKREGARSEINPPDMNALEVALQLKDAHGAHVSLLSMGPPFFERILRMALAMGADDLYLLSDRAFAGADTLATTYTLARGIEKLGDVDLILCGEESADGATGQVPAGIAAWLGIPQVTLVSSLEFEQGLRSLRARRETGGGYAIQRVHLPAVLSIKTAANEPRFMDFHRKLWAMEKAEVVVWDRTSIDADPAYIGLRGSPTTVVGLREAEAHERRRERLEGPPEKIAHQLAEILRPLLAQ